MANKYFWDFGFILLSLLSIGICYVETWDLAIGIYLVEYKGLTLTKLNYINYNTLFILIKGLIY
jgi:hypothetical protein